MPTLSELISERKSLRGFSYADLENRAGSVITRQRWQQLGTGVRIKEFPEPATLEAMAAALDTDVAEVVLAAARSIGLDVKRGARSDLAARLPSSADRLSVEQRDAIVTLVRSITETSHAEQPATDTADPTPAARAQGTEDQKILPEVPDHIYEKWRTPNAHGLRADPGRPWLKSKFEARRARENAEIEEYGATLPTVPDDSLEPRALARDVALFNFGDQRVMLPEGRENVIRDFADKIGVELDSDQTFAVKKRPWQEVEDEVAAALGRYLLQVDSTVKPADLIQFPSSTQAGSSAVQDSTTDDVLHLVAPTAGSQPDSLAASAYWPDGKEVAIDEYEGYKLWIADGTPDGWLQYRLMHQAGIPAAADDRGAADEGESDRARREQDEAVEGSQDDE